MTLEPFPGQAEGGKAEKEGETVETDSVAEATGEKLSAILKKMESLRGGRAVVLVYYFCADDWGYVEREEGEEGDLFVPGGRGVVGGEVLDWK